ncbi:MFS transporter [Apilactobacillus bombintestini]|uniref:MFS transporter n=1 Tax=Apilactobacillus bombintestini TaxID=2419772 RepID=A0A387AQ10_9LACO|nr:MFS transporter [Apilactobacillus bombintestini]AYF92073.1 MFS transporter [Apilactobacillus bombintestini]
MENVQSHSAMTKSQKWVLASTTIGQILECMDSSFVSFALSSIIVSLNISTAQAGMLSTITSFGTLLGGILFGLLADRFGRVKILTYTIFIFAFATTGIMFVQNFTALAILRFLVGVGTGGEYGSGVAMICESFKKKQGRSTSISTIGGQVGSILSAAVSSAMIPLFGWRALFLIGIIPIFFAFIIRRNLKESQEFIDTMQRKDRPKVSIKKLFATPRLAWQTGALIVMVIVQIAGYYGLINWLPSIMQKQLGLSVSKSALWTIVTFVGMSIGMMTFGTILDKFGPRKAFGMFLLIAAVAVYGITFAFNAATLLLAATVLGFFSNGMYCGYGVIISRLYHIEIRSTANNFIMGCGRAIGGFSPAVIGLLMENHSLLLIMGTLSILYLISFSAMMSIPGLRNMQQD